MEANDPAKEQWIGVGLGRLEAQRRAFPKIILGGKPIVCSGSGSAGEGPSPTL